MPVEIFLSLDKNLNGSGAFLHINWRMYGFLEAQMTSAFNFVLKPFKKNQWLLIKKCIQPKGDSYDDDDPVNMNMN